MRGKEKSVGFEPKQKKKKKKKTKKWRGIEKQKTKMQDLLSSSVTN